MAQCQPKRKKKLDLAYAIKSFTGYLEGTHKSALTIKNYRSDLNAFADFLETGLGSQRVSIAKLNRSDLELYHEHLKAQGFKTNTRRRKLLTVRKLFHYLSQRNKVSEEMGKRLPTPFKVERIPHVVESSELIEKIRALPENSELRARNRVLLWTLAETGCLVSEVTHLRFDHWGAPRAPLREVKSVSGEKPKGAFVSIEGKNQRQIAVSNELYHAVKKLEGLTHTPRPYLFLGYNKFGSLGSPITPRGVELLVKSHIGELGFGKLTPRTFRHSAVVRWWKEGADRAEILKRLGLRTDYAFRLYEPLLKSISKTTSSSATPPSKS